MRRKSDYRYRKKKKFLIVCSVILFVLLVLFFCINYLLTAFRIENVLVEGNIHYTNEEIEAYVLKGDYSNNSLYISHKYKDKGVEDIPFVETIDVKVISRDTIKITVYEKTLAGYIAYLGRYIYFDKDGIVVESSLVKTQGVPEVVGVDFEYVILHEKLPAKDDELFKKVLDVTKLMSKYGVDAEKMYFADDGRIVLYKNEITINLGKEDNLDIKIMNLPSILINLEGKKGTLRMENYDEGTKRVSFEVKD